ncbi:MAG: hypothetical protein LBC93_05005 [Synergistaceae bacterium]|nr:hypothetical protein [Synergistaceae bacterium]
MLPAKELQEANVNAGFQMLGETNQPQGGAYGSAEQDNLSHRLDSALQDKMGGAPLAPTEELQRKLTDLTERFERLSSRHKHIVEERDVLSRQVAELRRKLDEKGEVARGHDAAEEIRMLGKLMEADRRLREMALERGLVGDDPYLKHEKFVDAFFKIVTRDTK